MILKKTYFFILFLFFTCFSFAQKDSLAINLSKQVLLPGDTLEIDADLFTANHLPINATLNCVIEDENGNQKKMRWPMIKGQSTFDLIITDSLVKGHYQLHFAVQPLVFKVLGKVLFPHKIPMMNASMITGRGDWILATVPVNEDGSFVFKNTLFENKATLIFSRPGKGNKYLDISLQSLLDSTFQPTALATKMIVIGPTKDTIIKPILPATSNDTSIFFDQHILATVVVKGKQKSKADEYNEKYSTGLFQDMNERVLNLIDDPSAQNGSDIFMYLQGRVAGLQINENPGGEPSVKMRGDTMQFYLDELRVDAENIRSVSISDIAIIKIYPPPFFGNTGGSGGGIGIYTRHGADIQSTNGSHIFRVNGYAPVVGNLSMK